ncbi:hypothetical protein [Methylobacterium sp. CM6244]
MAGDLREMIRSDRLKAERAASSCDRFIRLEKRAKAANIRADNAEKERDLARSMLALAREELAARRSALTPEIKEANRGEG